MYLLKPNEKHEEPLTLLYLIILVSAQDKIEKWLGLGFWSKNQITSVWFQFLVYKQSVLDVFDLRNSILNIHSFSIFFFLYLYCNMRYNSNVLKYFFFFSF